MNKLKLTANQRQAACNIGAHIAKESGSDDFLSAVLGSVVTNAQRRGVPVEKALEQIINKAYNFREAHRLMVNAQRDGVPVASILARAKGAPAPLLVTGRNEYTEYTI